MGLHRNSTFPALAALCAILLLPACDGGLSGIAPHPVPRALGFVDVTISGIGSDAAKARASAPGTSFVPSEPDNSGGTADGSIQLEQLSTGSFTQGARGSGGVRYLWATFRVRNAQQDGTPYDTPRQNLTFMAVNSGGTLNETAVVSLRRFDGSPADPALAAQIIPTGAVHQRDGQPASTRADVLQVYTEDEIASIGADLGTNVLPYGFVVDNPGTPGSRTLPASPAGDQFDGLVTFAFKAPLQASSSDDPFTITMRFAALDEDEVRITQSLEEQDPESAAAIAARAATIGATKIIALPGSTYDGATAICTVRTAGLSDSPTAYLVNRPVATIAVAAWNPLPILIRNRRQLAVTILDESQDPMNIPLSWVVADPTIVTTSSTGLATATLATGSTTLTGSACGISSNTVGLRTTDVVPVAAGGEHTLVLRGDGTVAAWGRNDFGQATSPAGATDVVQITAGDAHSVALRSDGTVVAWGLNGNGQATVPPGLTEIVQVAAGHFHSLALTRDGTITGWGFSDAGQATAPAGLTDVVQIAAGGYHSLALRSDGTVVAWGNDDSGQTSLPAGLTDVVQIAAGGHHSLALRSDGTVVAWGNDGSGQSTVPAGLADVVQIAAGSFHSLALRSDGTVVAWGFNTHGQSTVPTGLTGVVQVAGGILHSMALKSDGTIVAWGANSSGQTSVPADLVAKTP